MELAVGSTKTDTKLCTIDDICAIFHPLQSHMRLKFIYYKRVNGRFAFPSSKLLKVVLVLAVYDCFGNSIKCCAAIASGNITRAQEIFAMFGMAVVMTIRGFPLALNRNRLSLLYNDLDKIFPRSAYLQEHMEVEKCHHYLKRRFFILHNIMSTTLVPFVFMPLIKFLFAYDFEKKGPIEDDFHLNASWMPFGVKENLSAFPFIYVYELILALAAVNLLVTWDQVFVVTISHLNMYYKYIAKLLEGMDVREAKNPQKMEAFFEQLHQYIYMHQCLNRIASDLNNAFNLSILLSHMGMAASICFNLYLLSEATDYLSAATYISPCLLEMWLLYDVAKWGTLLETVTSRINEILYELPWYESSPQYENYTMMWMQGTHEPMRLTAFNVFNVNMKHFQDMMLLAYQMLTFMKSKSKL